MQQFDPTGKFAQLVGTVRSMAINAPSVLPWYAPNGSRRMVAQP